MSGTRHIIHRSPRRRVRLRVVTNGGSSLTVNVSAGGFCTGLMRVLPVDSLVEGRIDLDGQDVSFAGRVTWARPGDPRLNVMGRMGVCFEKIDPAFARSLAGPEAESATCRP
jgi:hypothetical protein